MIMDYYYYYYYYYYCILFHFSTKALKKHYYPAGTCRKVKLVEYSGAIPKNATT